MHLIVLHHLAQGGRYDGIGEHFGRARPATGFSCDLYALCAGSLNKLKRLLHQMVRIKFIKAIAVLATRFGCDSVVRE
jgi:ATP phosphoribosyltransferase regulatory subunit HisZ